MGYLLRELELGFCFEKASFGRTISLIHSLPDDLLIRESLVFQEINTNAPSFPKENDLWKRACNT